MRALSLTLALAALTLTGPAAAQDGSEGGATRTPAGAVNFLRAIAKEQGLNIWIERPRSDPGQAVTYVNLGVREAVAESDCVTVFSGTGHFYPGEFFAELGHPITSPPADAQKVDKFVAVTGLPRPPFRIDWKTMNGLRVAGGGSDGSAWHIKSGDYTFITSPNERPIYERLLFALKFLNERCSLPEVDGF